MAVAVVAAGWSPVSVDEPATRTCNVLTGATGRLGALLGQALLRESFGTECLLASWHASTNFPSWGLKAQWAQLDLARPAPFADWVLRRAPEAAQLRLFHFACTMRGDLNVAWSRDVMGSLALCQKLAAARPDVELIFASSTSAEGPDSEYGFAKRALEEELFQLANDGLVVRAVRIPPVYRGKETEQFAGKFLRSLRLSGGLLEKSNGDRPVPDQSQYDVLASRFPL